MSLRQKDDGHKRRRKLGERERADDEKKMRRERSEDNNMLTNRGSRWKDAFGRSDGANGGLGCRRGVENENDTIEAQ